MKKFKCAHCKTVMTLQSLGDSIGIIAHFAWYCENKDCPRYGLLAVAGYPVEESQPEGSAVAVERPQETSESDSGGVDKT